MRLLTTQWQQKSDTPNLTDKWDNRDTTSDII